MSHSTVIKSVPIKSVSALRSAVELLKERGVDCELLENKVPRLYFSNQIEDQFKNSGMELGKTLKYHDNIEECDYVLRLKDGMYDIGFLENDKGELVPIYDDYASQSSHARSLFVGGNNTIKDLLGNAVPEELETETTDSTGMVNEGGTIETYAVGKFLQAYTEAVVVETAEEQGHIVEEVFTDELGEIHVVVGVGL